MLGNKLKYKHYGQCSIDHEQKSESCIYTVIMKQKSPISIELVRSNMVSDLKMSTYSDSSAFVGSFINNLVTTSSASDPAKVVMKNTKCVVLQKDNNFSWNAKFLAMFRGLWVMEYVEGTVELSSLTVVQHDQLIILTLSWLLMGISPSIQLQVASYQTSVYVREYFVIYIHPGLRLANCIFSTNFIVKKKPT